MAKLDILNSEGKSSGSIELPEDVFGSRVNTRVLHQAMVMYHTSQRQGNASTKQRAEVRGGGKKPWRQKGTGRARHGSSRSPLWRGGGVTFGPLPKDYSYDVNKKIRHSALSESLKAKFQSKNLLCVENFKEDIDKTKDFAAILDKLKLEGTILIVVDDENKSIGRVTRNITSLSVIRVSDLNAFDIIQRRILLIGKEALEKILKRVKL